MFTSTKFKKSKIFKSNIKIIKKYQGLKLAQIFKKKFLTWI